MMTKAVLPLGKSAAKYVPIKVDDEGKLVLSSVGGVSNLDVKLSTRASESTLSAISSNIDVPLSTRASEATLSAISSNIDVLLSSRASESTLSTISSNIDTTLSSRASESTLSAINNQVSKLSFDASNRVITNVQHDFVLLDSTTTPLSAGGVYTGSWQLCNGLSKLIGTVISDQSFDVYIDFSQDGSNIDKSISASSSSETLSDGTSAQVVDFYVEPCALYTRLVIKNTSGSDQTFLRGYIRGRVV